MLTGFLAGNVDFGADDDFFTAFVYDWVVFDVDLGVFEFQHGAGVGADQQVWNSLVNACFCASVAVRHGLPTAKAVMRWKSK